MALVVSKRHALGWISPRRTALECSQASQLCSVEGRIRWHGYKNLAHQKVRVRVKIHFLKQKIAL
jgi:hypothetical protein